MIAAHWSAAVCILAMFAMLIGEYRQHKLSIIIFKVTASTAFVVTAWRNGALDSLYGQCVLAALILSWWGDVFLIPKSERIFKLGILAFLLGHLGFGAAFLTLGFDVQGALIGLVIIGLFSGGVLRWLYPKLDPGMKIPVVAYIGVISVMVVCAVAATWSSNRLPVLTGAVMFFLSDLAVARNRFVHPGFINKVWGLPLYYGAQVVLAYTIIDS